MELNWKWVNRLDCNLNTKQAGQRDALNAKMPTLRAERRPDTLLPALWSALLMGLKAGNRRLWQPHIVCMP